MKEIIPIQQKIFEIRGQKVMLAPIAIGVDLAVLYEVETRVLNQAIKRNIESFPDDFMFQLSKSEWQNMSSQFVMTYPIKRPKSAIPYAFTEHGVTMLASVLKSPKARQMNIQIVRAFIALRNWALNYKELADKIAQLENDNDKKFADIYEALNYLISEKEIETNQKERKKIGFK
ncbi:MAG: ORF6N domain-containing protein [Bacteroidetes bacterium]|nr:ORF6N domain-containing protein [Bacteroidota bacterium]